MVKNAKAQPVPGVVLAGWPIMRFSQALQLAVQTNLKHLSSQRRTFLFAVLVGVVGARCLDAPCSLVEPLGSLPYLSLCFGLSVLQVVLRPISLCVEDPKGFLEDYPNLQQSTYASQEIHVQVRSDPALPSILAVPVLPHASFM